MRQQFFQLSLTAFILQLIFQNFTEQIKNFIFFEDGEIITMIATLQLLFENMRQHLNPLTLPIDNQLYN